MPDEVQVDSMQSRLLQLVTAYGDLTSVLNTTNENSIPYTESRRSLNLGPYRAVCSELDSELLSLTTVTVLTGPSMTDKAYESSLLGDAFDEPTINNLTDGERVQLERLITEFEVSKALEAVPASNNKLLLNADYFEFITQGLTDDGYDQAKDLLSQGNAITPVMVEQLNELMESEESERREYLREAGRLSGEVKYPRFAEAELNHHLAPQFSQAESVQFPISQPQKLTTMPSVYDRPKFEIERMELLAMTLLQAGVTLKLPSSPLTVGDLLVSLDPDEPQRSLLKLSGRSTNETTYNQPFERYVSANADAFREAGLLEAMQNRTLETLDGQPVSIPDLLTWEQLNNPYLKLVEDMGYVMTVEADRLYRQQWTSYSETIPMVKDSIAAIPGYAGGTPTLKQLLDGQRVLLEQAQQSPLAIPLLNLLEDICFPHHEGGQDVSFYLQTTDPDRQLLRSGDVLEFSSPYTVSYSVSENSVSLFRPGLDHAVLTYYSETNAYFVDGLSPADTAFLQTELPALVGELELAHETSRQALVASNVQLPTLKPKESTTTSVYTRPQSELDAMEAHALDLLQQGETLVSPTSRGPVQLSLSDVLSDGGDRLVQRVYEETATNPGQRSFHLSTAVINDGILQSMQDGTLQTADGQVVMPPQGTQVFAPEMTAQSRPGLEAQREALQRSLDASTSSPQAPASNTPTDFTAPTVIVAVPDLTEKVQRAMDAMAAVPSQQVSSQGEQVEPQKAPAADYVENVPTKPRTRTMANAMVAEATQIDLTDLMSVKANHILGGDVPQKRIAVEGKSNLIDRDPKEALTITARAAYGAENFCAANGLAHTSADQLVGQTATALGMSAADTVETLAVIKREDCVPGIVTQTHSEAGVWARIEEKYPEYASKVPEAIKTERTAGEAALEKPKLVLREATTRETALPTPVLSPEAQAIAFAEWKLTDQATDKFVGKEVSFARLPEGGVTIADKAGTPVVMQAKDGSISGNLPANMDFSKAYEAHVNKTPEQMAVVVAEYRLATDQVDRFVGKEVTFNRAQTGNISIIDNKSNAVVVTKNAQTGAVTGKLPEGQDYSKPYQAIVKQAAEARVAVATKVVAPKQKAG
ncbi:MAG: hypothetical protein RBJ76_01065 [Stenomitos frigidus ULC029]